MLRYLDKGIRHFWEKPHPTHKRMNWEFYAVLDGKCAPVNSEQERPLLKSRYLWAFPRGAHHSWIGEVQNTCTVVCFHFAYLPDLLEKTLTESGSIGRNITESEAIRLKELADELESDYINPTKVSYLRFNKALFDLSLMAIKEIPVEQIENTDKRDSLRVETAIRWYREHLAQNPSVADVARSVNMSPSHLRRIFLHIRKENPHECMAKIRLACAKDLMTGTDYKLDYIALASGFFNSSDFCRVFKATHGMTPDKWRKSILPPYDPIPKYSCNPSNVSDLFLQRNTNMRKQAA
jgi:AraC family transcriptional regulator